MCTVHADDDDKDRDGDGSVFPESRQRSPATSPHHHQFPSILLADSPVLVLFSFLSTGGGLMPSVAGLLHLEPTEREKEYQCTTTAANLCDTSWRLLLLKY